MSQTTIYKEKSSANLQLAISQYSEAGFTLFPLNGKIPPKGFSWPKAEFDPFPSIDKFPSGNFGIKLESKDLIIDVDPRNFKEENTFEKFMGLFVIPLNFVVRTGSGGVHIYLTKPPELSIKGALKAFPGIEFKTRGQYVVGASSLHPDTGNEYIIQGECDWTARPAPIELLALIERKEVIHAKGTQEYVNDSQTIARYREYLSKAPLAIEGESGDKTTFAVAAVGHDFGLHPDDALCLMLEVYNPLCQPPWSADELKRKVYNAYKYTQGELGSLSPKSAAFPMVTPEISEIQEKLFHRNQDSSIKKDQHNTVLFFAPKFPLEAVLGYNLFANRIEFLKKAPWHHEFEQVRFWNDGEALRCKYWMSAHYKYEPNTNIMHEAAYVAAKFKSFHPVKDYWESVKWDGTPRLHNWLVRYAGANDNDYTRAVGLKTLIAAVKRVYEPGCKFDYVLVLEGPQGIGKSSIFKIMAGEEWFTDSTIDISKEWSIMKTFGKLMVEWAEMVSHSKGETNALRGFITSTSDNVRLPYARLAQDIPRQCIFVGSINPESDADLGWLKDTTGNRRYWPVPVTTIDLTNLCKVRDQLWAEALSYYKKNAVIYFDDVKLDRAAKAEQAKRIGRDMWEDTVIKYLDSPLAEAKMVITATDVYRDALGGNILHCGRREQARIASIMESLGWEKGVHHSKELNKPVRGYKRPELIVEVLI